MKTEHTDVIYKLIQELATELDLHYEDEDFLALKDTIQIMQEGAMVLAEAGREPPNAYIHALVRLRRQQN